jgi:hypothetical protein
VDFVKRRFRSVSAIVVALTALVIAGLFVPAATAVPGNTLIFVTQPQDSEAGATIRSADLNQASAFVQVKLVDSDGNLVTNSNSKVTFSLQAGAGFASGSLSVTPQPLVGGIATFGEGTLKINTPNEPFFTSYGLVPSTTGGGPRISGAPSAPFDIFQDGESCASGETCDAVIRDGNDVYSVPTVGTLGASQIPSSTLPGFDCAGQTEIFATSVFVHETTEADTSDGFEPVLLVSHVTRREMKAATNNGQAHVWWCLALVSAAPWEHNGAPFEQQDTNGDGTLDLYVGKAPACPNNASAPDFAPCIVSQSGDGSGGNITTGWVPGGDPPRRS